MMVNIGSRVVPVNIAFSSSKIAALIESKMLQYTTSSINLHHCTLSETKISIENTLPTCVDMANEDLHAYNTGIGVKSHKFCSLHQCKCASYTMFLITFVLSN